MKCAHTLIYGIGLIFIARYLKSVSYFVILDFLFYFKRILINIIDRKAKCENFYPGFSQLVDNYHLLITATAVFV